MAQSVTVLPYLHFAAEDVIDGGSVGEHDGHADGRDERHDFERLFGGGGVVGR